MRFNKLIIFIIILFGLNSLSGSVLTEINDDNVGKSINDNGQFNNEFSFNNNPVSVANVQNKSIGVGYIKFYNGLGYNMNAFSLKAAADFNYLKAGIGLGYFKDSDSIIDYNEFKIRVALSSDYFISQYIRNLVIGIGSTIVLENLNITYNEDLISGNEYKNTEINFDVGLSYIIRRIKFGFALKNLLTASYIIGGVGYQFSKISCAGISVKYIDNDNVKIGFGLSNSVIDNVLNLYVGFNSDEIVIGTGFKVFKTVIEKGDIYFNYTFNYNFELKDTHYVSIKYKL